MKKLNLVAFCGSLRTDSYNKVALHALAELAPDYCDIRLTDISSLPLFNPDLENQTIPAVATLKQSVGTAHGIIIASPEYAHGISGPMKNALDWLVSGTEFPYKPVMLVNTSPRASHAQAQLKEVLNTMSANIIDAAQLTLPLLGSNLNCQGVVASVEFKRAIGMALSTFVDAVSVGLDDPMNG